MTDNLITCNGCKSYRKFMNEKKLEQCNNKHYKNVIDPNLVFSNLHHNDDMATLTTLHNNIINPYEIKINQCYNCLNIIIKITHKSLSVLI